MWDEVVARIKFWSFEHSRVQSVKASRMSTDWHTDTEFDRTNRYAFGTSPLSPADTDITWPSIELTPCNEKRCPNHPISVN